MLGKALYAMSILTVFCLLAVAVNLVFGDGTRPWAGIVAGGAAGLVISRRRRV